MKKNTTIIKLIRKINSFFKNFFTFFQKYNLSIKYLNKYGKEKLSRKKILKLFLTSLGFKFIMCERSFPKCVIKPSKIIIYEADDVRLLFVFDRQVSKDYWELRNKWSEFHYSPGFIKVDEFAYFQSRSIGSGSLLSLNNDNLCKYLLGYLNSQIDLGQKYGKKIALNEFMNKPYSFLIENNYLEGLPLSVCSRLKSLINSNELLTTVPSIIEPWPYICTKNLEFSDLSPVEFRSAPLFHDFCYMLMKYEMYGGRQKEHKPFLPKLFSEIKIIENQGYIETDNYLTKLAKKISSIVSYNEFTNIYILMMLFHCFVKYNSTGRFLFDVPEQRIITAINIHANIFNQIIE